MLQRALDGGAIRLRALRLRRDEVTIRLRALRLRRDFW
jgi:hypothetical protein